MKCERGDHGEMVMETGPRVHRCLVCGAMHYPAYKDNVADGADTGARRHFSPKQKAQRKAIIRSLAARGYTNPEIVDTTGYALANVRKDASGVVRPL